MLFLAPLLLGGLALFFAVRPSGPRAPEWRRDWAVVLGLLGGAVAAHQVARILGAVPVGPLRLIGGGVPRGLRGVGYAAAVGVFAWQAAEDATALSQTDRQSGAGRNDAVALAALAVLAAGIWRWDLVARAPAPDDADDD